MDKLQLTGQNVDRVFNSRVNMACGSCISTKQPNLELKTRPQQLLTFALPAYVDF